MGNADSRLRRFRIQVFASTWLSYVGFYFCRHAFYVLKPELTRELGITASELGDIGLVYLVSYAVGQFVSAAVGERTGARVLLLAGMGLSAVANIAFGFANTYWTFFAFMALNGLTQATGWSGNVGTMARWFRRRERGTVMGLWATCYQIGGALAKGSAAFVLGILGWRWSFWAASLVLIGIWFVFLFLQRNRPEDVGLELKDEDEPAKAGDAASAQSGDGNGWTSQMITTVAIIGVAYFFIKFVRYALWSWGTYFLDLNFGLTTEDAGYVSTIFDLAGFVGVVIAGVLSDRLFRGRRSGISLALLLGMTATTGVLWGWGGASLLVFVICFGLIGFTLYGPDSLLSGAAAMDAGGGAHALAAAGIINGLGSIGAVAQEKVIGWLYDAGQHGVSADALDSLSAAATSTFVAAGGGPGALVGLSSLSGTAAQLGPAQQDLNPILAALAVSAAGAAAAILVLWILAKLGKSRV